MNNIVSIVCPIFNSDMFLDETILSVVNQTNSSWELVLVDDGSTDNSGAICDRFASKNPSIKVIHKKNEGQMKARIDGIKASKGEYILFLDSDDLLESNAVSIVLKQIQKNKIFDGVIFNATVFPKKEKNKELPKLLSTRSLNSNREIMETAFGSQMLGYLWMYCFNKKLLMNAIDRQNDFLNVRYTEDGAFIFKTLSNCNNLIVITENLYKYRENEESITHNLTNHDRYDRFRVFNYIYESIYRIYKDFAMSNGHKVFVSWSAFSYLERIENKKEFKKAFKEVRNSFLFKHIIKRTKAPTRQFFMNTLLLKINCPSLFYRFSYGRH